MEEEKIMNDKRESILLAQKRDLQGELQRINDRESKISQLI